MSAYTFLRSAVERSPSGSLRRRTDTGLAAAELPVTLVVDGWDVLEVRGKLLRLLAHGVNPRADVLLGVGDAAVGLGGVVERLHLVQAGGPSEQHAAVAKARGHRVVELGEDVADVVVRQVAGARLRDGRDGGGGLLPELVVHGVHSAVGEENRATKRGTAEKLGRGHQDGTLIVQPPRDEVWVVPHLARVQDGHDALAKLLAKPRRRRGGMRGPSWSRRRCAGRRRRRGRRRAPYAPRTRRARRNSREAHR